MDWSNESYVRIYVRDTTTWRRLGWDGQCVLTQVLRKVDMSGVLDIDDVEPWEAVVLHCGAPEDAARRGMAACLERGVLEHRGASLVAPNYVEAQTAIKSDKLRQAESRERRRLEAMGRTVTERDGEITPRDAQSQNVTDGHAATGAVTPGHAESLSAVLCSALPSSALPCSAGCEGGAAAPPPAAPLELAPTLVLPKRKRKPPKDPLGQQIATAAVWDAYAVAYRERYPNSDPQRNKRINGQLVSLIERIPAEDAPYVAAHYVGSNDRFYVLKGHDIGSLLANAETLRTQWLTGQRTTAHQAHEADKREGRGAEYEKAFAPLAAIKLGGANANS